MSVFIRAAKNYTDKPDTAMFDMHVHDSYEVFCFLSGNAHYYVEGNIYELSPGDILIINKAEVHSLLINKITPYLRIVINFSIESLLGDHKKIYEILSKKPLGQFNLINGSMEEKNQWLYYLENIVTDDENQKQIYLTVLLNELCKSLEKRQQLPPQHPSDRIIAYINQNLSQIESLEQLCELFYISKTHLNRRFKAITGSTVWEYITTKRILKAKELLSEGHAPTDVSLMLGYKEYSTFYRAYKRHLGETPKFNHIKKAP